MEPPSRATAVAGVNADATTIITNAMACSAMPIALPGSGSPKTMMPPAMHEMFAAVPVIAIVSTVVPSWKERARRSGRHG